MKPAVGVRFKRAGKIYYFEAADCPDIGIGHQVVVDTSQGRELGRVVIAPDQLVEARPAGRLKPIVRVASSEDLEEQRQLRGRESEVLGEVMSEIVRLKLPMRAVMAEYSFDASRLTVYFVSEEQRVDFRDLVRDLTKRYDARVNLRQIGPRDRAKLLGGIDRCGRELCCTTWMPDFQPIQIRMAKNQQLPLNPSEISGVCGKLLCCLAFEDGQYSEMKQGMPKLGAKLTSAVGRGRVVDVNLITRKITIQWETGTRVEVDATEFAEQQARREKAFGPPDTPPATVGGTAETGPPAETGSGRPERPAESRPARPRRPRPPKPSTDAAAVDPAQKPPRPPRPAPSSPPAADGEQKPPRRRRRQRRRRGGGASGGTGSPSNGGGSGGAGGSGDEA